MTKKIIKEILIEGKGATYYSFSNADGKNWIIPKQNMRTGLSLYQPSGIKGKLLKKHLPCLIQLTPIMHRLAIIRSSYMLQENLNQLLTKVFNCHSSFEFSVFAGTPSVHQKVTIQISSKENILGYCKVTDKAEICAIFKHEQQVLYRLRKNGIEAIPKCLYCGKLKEDIFLFIQTTTKSNQSKVIHTWNHKHTLFIKDLHRHTAQTISFKQSDYCHTLNELVQLNKCYPEKAIIRCLDTIIHFVYTHWNREPKVFSAYHGDFTPWNTIEEKNNLFVFDWEYAKLTYPPYMDFFHFFTQTGFFEKHWNTEQIYKGYLKLRKYIANEIENPDILYISYLLEIICLYMNRDHTGSDPNTRQMIAERIELLSLLYNGITH